MKGPRAVRGRLLGDESILLPSGTTPPGGKNPARITRPFFRTAPGRGWPTLAPVTVLRRGGCLRGRRRSYASRRNRASARASAGLVARLAVLALRCMPLRSVLPWRMLLRGVLPRRMVLRPFLLRRGCGALAAIGSAIEPVGVADLDLLADEALDRASSGRSSRTTSDSASPVEPRGRCGRCGARNPRERAAGRSSRRAAAPRCRGRARRCRWRPAPSPCRLEILERADARVLALVAVDRVGVDVVLCSCEARRLEPCLVLQNTSTCPSCSSSQVREQLALAVRRRRDRRIA
jgi:hypothetical protein